MTLSDNLDVTIGGGKSFLPWVGSKFVSALNYVLSPSDERARRSASQLFANFASPMDDCFSTGANKHLSSGSKEIFSFDYKLPGELTTQLADNPDGVFRVSGDLARHLAQKHSDVVDVVLVRPQQWDPHYKSMRAYAVLVRRGLRTAPVEDKAFIEKRAGELADKWSRVFVRQLDELTAKQLAQHGWTGFVPREAFSRCDGRPCRDLDGASRHLLGALKPVMDKVVQRTGTVVLQVGPKHKLLHIDITRPPAERKSVHREDRYSLPIKAAGS